MARRLVIWVWWILYCRAGVLSKLVLLVMGHIPEQVDQLENGSWQPFIGRIVCFRVLPSAKKQC